MSQRHRRLAAIMYIDMVGYTALGQRDEESSIAAVEVQRSVLDPVLARHDGRKVKTMGDAFLVVFSNALEAARCAYDIQRSTREFNMAVSREKKLHLRVGIHLGDVVEDQGDILGDAVNVASRIEPLADEGGVCLTRQVYDHVHNKLDVRLESLGKKSLKNVSEQVEVYKMLMPWDDARSTSTTKFDRRRIAVLPFANISPDAADEYFADGMTEEIISAMSRLPGLQVIARTSVLNYKKGAKLSTVADELRVGTVIEGSVRKAGNRVRVTAQLIDVPTESHLWSERYDRDLDDIFRIQDDIAGNIASTLQVKLATAPEPIRKQTENIDAYALYLKGRSFWNKRNKDAVIEAMRLFEEAIRIDPNYAKAYSGLADAYIIAAGYMFIDKKEGLEKGRRLAEKALALDDSQPEAHASLGNLMHNEHRHSEAAGELRRAIELNPSYASAHHWYSNCLLELGSIEEAYEEILKAHELDPLSPVITDSLAVDCAFLGRIDEAIVTLDKLTKMEPDYSLAYRNRAFAFLLKNMKERAFDELESYRKRAGDEFAYKSSLSCLHAWFGERDKAQALIEELQEMDPSSTRLAGSIALTYAILGDADEFYKWMERAIATKTASTMLLRYTPFYDKVKNDARFPRILEKIGLQ